MKKIFWIILSILGVLLILLIGLFITFKYIVYPLDKDGMINTYRVHCDEDLFITNNRKYTFEPGREVELVYDFIATDTNYSFYVDGVDDFTTTYDETRGYVITFTMPSHDVRVRVGMDNTMERLDEEEIESLVISMGGGRYDTMAGTTRIDIVFEDDYVILNAHCNAYEEKEETDLTKRVEVDLDAKEELYSLTQSHLWELQNALEEDTGILDETVNYIIVNQMSYGGYAIRNQCFTDIIRKTFDVVGRDNIEEFRKEIYEWYEEEY